MTTNSYDSKRYALVNRFDKRHLTTIATHLAPEKGERVLEVGCGAGHVTSRLGAQGIDITGIDANPNAAEVAVGGDVRHMFAQDLDFPDATFDKLLSIHAIEHIPPLEEAIAEMARVLKPGGRAMHVYPAEPIQGIFAVPTAVILHRNPLKAREVHCHWLWPKKVRALMEPAGFKEIHSEFNLLSSPQFVSVFERV